MLRAAECATLILKNNCPSKEIKIAFEAGQFFGQQNNLHEEKRKKRLNKICDQCELFVQVKDKGSQP